MNSNRRRSAQNLSMPTAASHRSSKTLCRLRLAKVLPPTLAVALVAVSCSSGVSRIHTRSLPSPNPTTYSFPLPLEEVRGKALDAFSIEHQIDHPIFERPASNLHLESALVAECSTNVVFGHAIFQDPANTNDIYLQSFHSPLTISPIYYGRDGGLPFIAAFHLHLTTSGSNTFVNVIASDTEVVNGTKFGFGPCGPGQGWNCVSVKPTTVEEYSILRYLGNYLGFTNMPAVILPTTGEAP